MAALIQDVLRGESGRRSLSSSAGVWILVVLCAAVFFPTLSALARIWLEVADYQHGWLAAAISVGLLFAARKRITAQPALAFPLVLPILAVAVIVWMVAWRANSDMLQQVLFPIVLLLAILAAFGPAIARVTAFPIAYFYFSVPIWDHFVPLLQWLTTVAAENAMALLGVPTVVEGHNVTIPAGRFSIIEGCSGKRYFVVALAFAALAGFMQQLRWQRLAVLLGVAAGISLLTNWIRVSIVIYAGHVSNMQHYLVAVEHKTLGYVLFLPMLFLIGWFARRLEMRQQLDAASPSQETAIRSATRLNAIAGPIAILLAATFLLWRTPVAADAKPVVHAPPLLTGEWQGPLPANLDWQPHFVGWSEERRASYKSSNATVELYANVYGEQSPGHELVFHANSAAPSDAWLRVSWLKTDAPLTIGVFSSLSKQRWAIAQTYVVGGQVSASAALAQWRYGWNALWAPVPSGAIALAVRCDDDCTSAAAAIDSFWAAHGGALASTIPNSL